MTVITNRLMPHSVIVASFPVQAKIPRVIPANAGIQAERGGVTVKNLDSRVRGNDGKGNRIHSASRAGLHSSDHYVKLTSLLFDISPKLCV